MSNIVESAVEAFMRANNSEHRSTLAMTMSVCDSMDIANEAARQEVLATYDSRLERHPSNCGNCAGTIKADCPVVISILKDKEDAKKRMETKR